MKYRIVFCVFWTITNSCGFDQIVRDPDEPWNQASTVLYPNGELGTWLPQGNRSEFSPRMETGSALTTTRQDPWYQIEDQTSYPFSTFGQIGGCSGTLVGPKHVLTAAHCIYLHPEKYWEKDLNFVIRTKWNGTQSIQWREAYIPNEFISKNDARYDYALVLLQQSVGYDRGWLSIHEGTQKKPAITMIGYPRNQPPGSLWSSSCTVESSSRSIYYHRCNSSSGSSGSPLLSNLNIIGIHTHGHYNINDPKYGTRMSKPILGVINGWIRG